MRVWLWVVVVSMALALMPARAWALVHVVQAGDTLAAVAERYYGRIQHERLLVAANRLESSGRHSLGSGHAARDSHGKSLPREEG